MKMGLIIINKEVFEQKDQQFRNYDHGDSQNRKDPKTENRKGNDFEADKEVQESLFSSKKSQENSNQPNEPNTKKDTKKHSLLGKRVPLNGGFSKEILIQNLNYDCRKRLLKNKDISTHSTRSSSGIFCPPPISTTTNINTTYTIASSNCSS